MSSFTPCALEPVEHLDQRQLDLLQQAAQLELGRSRLAAGPRAARAPRPPRAARSSPPSTAALDARLVEQLVERIAAAAPGRSGTPPPIVSWRKRRSVRRSARRRAARARCRGALDRLPVVGDQRPLAPGARAARRASRRSPVSTSPPPRAAQRRRRRRRGARQRGRPVGHPARSRRGASRAAPRPAARPSRAAPPPRSPSASSRRRSGSRSSKRLNTSRSCERSGGSVGDLGHVDAGVDVALERRELLRDARQVGVLAQVLRRFAPEMSSMCASTSSSDPYCCSS